MSSRKLVFVDCEAPYGCLSPASGDMTEFGAVEYESRLTFHGFGCDHGTFTRFKAWLDEVAGPAPIFVSDNPAYDFQWINYYFDKHFGENPFGHSARRIGDFYAGTVRNFRRGSDWKRFRRTPHDHNPVNDAMGNVEAFEQILKRIAQ